MEIKRVCAEQTWNLRHEVMWPDRDIEYVKLEDDNEGIHFGLFVGVRMVSVISLFVEGESAQFRKFATSKSEQGKGYGISLLKTALYEMKELGVKRVWCNARISKVEFYKKFGFCKTDKCFEKGGKSYVIMEYFF